jgi:hypothetical protein
MYSPKPAPYLSSDPKAVVGSLNQLSTYVADELQSVAGAASDPVNFLQLNVLHVAPEKPRDGQVVCADGTDWQPLGAGGGFFGYFGGAWVKLNN